MENNVIIIHTVFTVLLLLAGNFFINLWSIEKNKRKLADKQINHLKTENENLRKEITYYKALDLIDDDKLDKFNLKAIALEKQNFKTQK